MERRVAGAIRRRNGCALPHRRLHRLLYGHSPCDYGGQAVPPPKPINAELQVGADRLSRPRLVDPREWSAFPAANGATQRRGGRAFAEPHTTARLRIRRLVFCWGGEGASRAHWEGEGRIAIVLVFPVYGLVAARHAMLCVERAGAGPFG